MSLNRLIGQVKRDTARTQTPEEVQRDFRERGAPPFVPNVPETQWVQTVFDSTAGKVGIMGQIGLDPKLVYRKIYLAAGVARSPNIMFGRLRLFINGAIHTELPVKLDSSSAVGLIGFGTTASELATTSTNNDMVFINLGGGTGFLSPIVAIGWWDKCDLFFERNGVGAISFLLAIKSTSHNIP